MKTTRRTLLGMLAGLSGGSYGLSGGSYGLSGGSYGLSGGSYGLFGGSYGLSGGSAAKASPLIRRHEIKWVTGTAEEVSRIIIEQDRRRAQSARR